MTNLTPEMIEKAKAAKSAEELLDLAKENNIEMDEEEAAIYFDQLNPKSGALSDDELDNVSGGGCYNKGELVVTVGTSACEHYRCKHCGAYYESTEWGSHTCMHGGLLTRVSSCGSCLWCEYKDGLWKCTNPNKKK